MKKLLLVAVFLAALPVFGQVEVAPQHDGGRDIGFVGHVAPQEGDAVAVGALLPLHSGRFAG